MSTITSDPILLNETGLLMLDEMKRQNAYLAMLAEGKRSEIYSSMSQIASIVRGNDVEHNQQMFPIGDQIVMPWKDLDDTNHNTDDNAYRVAWNIVHHGLVELQDGRVVPGMFIQMDKCSAYGVQFSHIQAFYQAAEALAAGTYHVTFGVKYSDSFVAGSVGQFTLTQELPVGGRLVVTGNKVQAWASAVAATFTEEVNLTAGDGATSLGTIDSTTRLSADGLNCMQRITYGHNRWSTSAIRQYLNALGQNWFASKEDFDIRPDQYGKYGFMAGFSDEFLAAIKPVKVTTALNTVEGFATTTEDTFDTFFLPSLQQMNINPQLANVEGDTFEWWKEALGRSTFVGTGSNNIFDAFKVPAINTNSPQGVRLRSAARGHAYFTWGLSTSGYAGNSASSALRFSPVCVIC